MLTRLIHAVVFAIFTILAALYLSHMMTDYADLRYGYTILSGDVNQMVAEGGLVIEDEELLRTIMGRERIDFDHFGEELQRKYSASSGTWFTVAAGSWLMFGALIFFALYNWVEVFRAYLSGRHAAKYPE